MRRVLLLVIVCCIGACSADLVSTLSQAKGPVLDQFVFHVKQNRDFLKTIESVPVELGDPISEFRIQLTAMIRILYAQAKHKYDFGKDVIRFAALFWNGWCHKLRRHNPEAVEFDALLDSVAVAALRQFLSQAEPDPKIVEELLPVLLARIEADRSALLLIACKVVFHGTGNLNPIGDAGSTTHSILPKPIEVQIWLQMMLCGDEDLLRVGGGVPPGYFFSAHLLETAVEIVNAARARRTGILCARLTPGDNPSALAIAASLCRTINSLQQGVATTSKGVASPAC